MANKEQPIIEPTVDNWDEKYAKCEFCSSYLHTLPITITIKKDWFYYADVTRCSKCNKFHSIKFRYDVDLPKEIDNNDIRERIKKRQHSAFSCSNYDLAEIKLGKLCTPRADENFEQFKERYKKFREDYYKEMENEISKGI